MNYLLVDLRAFAVKEVIELAAQLGAQKELSTRLSLVLVGSSLLGREAPDPWMLASYLMQGGNMRIGGVLEVLTPRTNPALVAKRISCLAAEGEVPLAGFSLRTERGAIMGVPPRFLGECVEILSVLLSGGEGDFRGLHFFLKGAFLDPPPFASPRLVIEGDTSSGSKKGMVVIKERGATEEVEIELVEFPAGCPTEQIAQIVQGKVLSLSEGQRFFRLVPQ